MPFDEFCEALDGQPLTERQFSVLQRAGLMTAQDFVNGARKVQELVLLWGKGAGKDYLVAKVFAYMVFVVLSIAGDPAVHFGLAPYSRLDVINVAPSEDLARNVFFAYLKRFIGHELFNEFAPNLLADSIVFKRGRLGGQSYDVIGMWSLHSRASGLDGYNLLLWVMDEADAFLDSAKKSNADEIHNILRSSAITRMQRGWIGIVITYTRIEGGFAERLYERALKDQSGHFVVDRAATWEVRPSVSRDDPGIASDYENDPTDARAKYECIPKATEDAFFEFAEFIDNAVDPQRLPSAIVVSDDVITATRRDGMVLEYIGGHVELCQPERGRTYFLSGDAGLSGDSFALCLGYTETGSVGYPYLCPECSQYQELMAHADYELCRPDAVGDEHTQCGYCSKTVLEWNFGHHCRLNGWVRNVSKQPDKQISAGGQDFSLPVFYEAALVSFQPQRAHHPGEVNRPVDFNSVERVCEELIRSFHVVRVRFDPWNSAQMTQSLLSKTGCDVGEMSFANPEQYRRARLAKAMLYASMLHLLPDHERDKEWRQLQRKGNKVDHPEGGSKDKFDAESMTIWSAATYSCAALEAGWL